MADDFAVRLLKLMTRERLTTVQLAKAAGITPSSIYAYERGNFTPSYSALIRLAKTFNVSTDYLCGLKETP